MSDKVDKVDWNLSGSIISQIGELLDRASISLVRDNYYVGFQNLKAVRKIIVFKLDSVERERMKKLEWILHKRLRAKNTLMRLKNSYEINQEKNNNPSRIRSLISISSRPTSYLLEIYYERLMDLLDKYGFTIGIKEDEMSIGYD